MKVPFDALADPLFRNAKLARGAELPVLGRRVVFESNSPAVLDAVDRSFGSWARLAESFKDPPVPRAILGIGESKFLS